jgi:hypothetical protein
MMNAGHSIPPWWGGEFELLLYPKEFNEHVAVYEQVDETYTKRIVWRKNIGFFRCLPSLNPQWKSL